MSMQSEKINAQAAAFAFKPTQSWHRHLIGPDELTAIFLELEELKQRICIHHEEARHGQPYTSQ